jgi:hypothetical protein
VSASTRNLAPCRIARQFTYSNTSNMLPGIAHTASACAVLPLQVCPAHKASSGCCTGRNPACACQGEHYMPDAAPLSPEELSHP